MVFNSPTFLFLFLPLCLGLYYVVPRSWRNSVLLAASLNFYSWGEPKAIAVMLVSIATNYGYGRWLESLESTAARKWVVSLSVTTNLGLLVTFKYANWLWGIAQRTLSAAGVEDAGAWELEDIPLPVGISFFTFQAMSYVVDVYRKQAKPQRKIGDFALYISLFPQLIAGPIVRYKDVAAQIVERSASRSDFAEGVRRFIIGLGKKVLIADVLARSADQIFDGVAPDQLPASVAWLGLLCYSLQIYFDFSGYSDMAIGLSRMFGFHLLENFRWPYISRSVTEFWRRWHISLSSWYRDYLYIPLGGNRKGPIRTNWNLIVVFALCGLWHGASWSFLAWGLFHGAFLIVEKAGLSTLLERLPSLVRRCYLLLMVMVGWVFFRVETLPEALGFLGSMFGLGPEPGVQRWDVFLDRELALALGLGLLGCMPWVDTVWKWRKRLETDDAMLPQRIAFDGIEVLALVAVFLLAAVHISASRYSPFIYFRF